MANLVQYVNYTVYFSTQAALDAAKALFPISVIVNNDPLQLQSSPERTALIFNFVNGVNYNIPGGGLNPTAGMYGSDPFFLGLPSPGNQINNPNPSGVFMDGTQPFVTVPAQVGTQATNLIWVATFTLISNIPNGGVLQANIPIRRWMVGFENNLNSEGAGGSGIVYSRDASRTMDGVGWAFRGALNTSYLLSVTGLLPSPVNSAHSWERFYLRVRNVGVADIDIWKTNGFPSSNAGFRLYLKPNLSLDVKGVSSGGTETLVGNTGVLFRVGDFVKLDLVVEYGGASSSLNIFANSTFINGYTSATATGTAHAQTRLGTQIAGSVTGWELDFDDWHNAEVPTVIIVSSGVAKGYEAIFTPTMITVDGVIYTVYPSVDFTNGTHIRTHKNNSGSLGSFTGNIQSSNQGVGPQFVAAGNTLTSTTSADSLSAVTDANDITSTSFETIVCAAAALIQVYYVVAGGTPSNSVLGYSLNGVPTTQNIADSLSIGWKQVLWPGYASNVTNATGANQKNPPITPLDITFQKAANTSKVTINALIASVQYIGIWGVEDNSQTNLPRTNITHNAWFPTIASAFIGPPAGPVFAASVGGTYVGNGTEQSIQVPFPVHFLWIRPVANNNAGTKWFGASLAAHRGDGSGSMRPDLVTRMDYNTPFNPADEFTFTVVGSSLESNQNGVTYQYIAICDPSFQFMLCGAWSHKSSDTADINNLLDPTFAPIACFYSFDRDDNDLTIRLIYKGVGHTGTTANKIDGTALTNSGVLGVGQITSGTDNQNADGNQVNYAAFQQTNDCSQVLTQIGSYVGNGGSSQIISLLPTTNRFPLFVYVQPHNSAPGFVCDPSDVAPSSRRITDGVASNTGITAVGRDSITVGSTLNSNGITYEVFVICGDTAGFNNGEFIATPCQPTSLVPTPSVINTSAISIIPVGGIEFDGATATSLLKDVSGIYQLIPGQTHDILLDRQPVQKTLNVAIAPQFKTGYIGG